MYVSQPFLFAAAMRYSMSRQILSTNNYFVSAIATATPCIVPILKTIGSFKYRQVPESFSA